MNAENHLQNPEIDRNLPIPANELERLLTLNELELDYSELDQSFADLTKLAAKIAGTSISMINLIDTFTQWSVAPFGLPIRQSPREESICQYTILEENSGGLELNDLSADERFKDRSFVAEFPFLKYYFGIPLKVNDNPPIGTLCVLHQDYRELTDEKKEILGMIAQNIVTRIKFRHALGVMERQVQESIAVKNNVAHDIRGPISGIVGLAEIIQLQGEDNTMNEVLNYIDLIKKSGQSVFDLANEILSVNQESSEEDKKPKEHQFTLHTLEEKILNLYGPQAITKQITLNVETTSFIEEIPFSKVNILQILGNLISNSIKFTSAGGTVDVILSMEEQDRHKVLLIKVKDGGVGMSAQKIEEILQGGTISSDGTSGEKGYGFGLNLVHRLVTNLKGQMQINSKTGQGAEFILILPFS